jgi:plastocyanin
MNRVTSTAIERGVIMRVLRRIAIAIAVAAALIVLVGCSSPSGSGATGTSGSGSSAGTGSGTSAVTVSLANIAFNPSQIDVAVGGTVTFVNNYSVTHDIVGGSWDSGQLARGASFSQTFPTAGTVPIHCTIHPSMTGSITVK